MKKLLIGLLIVAAAAGAFFYLRNEKKPIVNGELVKEQLIGTWKLESIKGTDDSTTNLVSALVVIADSNTFRYDYEFTKDNVILRHLGDSTSADTSRYEWKKNDLVWKETTTDSSGSLLTVMTLNADSLLLRSSDSTFMLFTKRK
jgi:hypothetical protein